MLRLIDLSEIVGFFSYSRDDDNDSGGGLSSLRDRIHRELRGQLGRKKGNFRLWQDKEAISYGKKWELEISNAIAQSVFFIPIITPTSVTSAYCKLELESFLLREANLGREDLIFPIYYIDTPELENTNKSHRGSLDTLSDRQWLDWRKLRHKDIRSTETLEEVSRFCARACLQLRDSQISD